MHLERNDDVFVLHLGDGENRYNADSVGELGALIAEVAAASGPKALVTVGDGKFWSNGLDLDALRSSRGYASATLGALHEVYAAILEAGFPTIAALQGHCYAGGAITAMAHDVRIMREDRGYFCFPEVEIGIPFSPGMSALISSKLTPASAQQAMVFGRRYAGPDAAAAGIVDDTAAELDLLPRAIACAAELAPKAGPTMRTLKQTLYAPVLAALRDRANNEITALFD